jgi:hypothetical protein
MTSTTVGTRIDLALIDILLTMGADETRIAITLVIRDKVNAGTAILAGIDCTVINVCFTMFSSETGWALTLIVGFTGHLAGTTIETRCCHPTVVNFDVTIDTCVTVGTVTLVTRMGVFTISSIFAGTI